MWSFFNDRFISHFWQSFALFLLLPWLLDSSYDIQTQKDKARARMTQASLKHPNNAAADLIVVSLTGSAAAAASVQLQAKPHLAWIRSAVLQRHVTMTCKSVKLRTLQHLIAIFINWLTLGIAKQLPLAANITWRITTFRHIIWLCLISSSTVTGCAHLAWIIFTVLWRNAC